MQFKSTLLLLPIVFLALTTVPSMAQTSSTPSESSAVEMVPCPKKGFLSQLLGNFSLNLGPVSIGFNNSPRLCPAKQLPVEPTAPVNPEAPDEKLNPPEAEPKQDSGSNPSVEDSTEATPPVEEGASENPSSPSAPPVSELKSVGANQQPKTL
jgi:hypothetical protein